MVLQKHTSAIALALLFAFAAAPKLLAASFTNSVLLAQSPASFPLPTAVPSDTTVRVNGSTSMIVINETLKQRFEAQYAGSQVDLQAQGTDAALQALRDGELDLAAIGRPLTQAEKAEGFVEVPISREKIAIVVSPNNPFNGNLTFTQFAQIFRGEITDWSQLGGAPGAIRFVDRPDSSDTRQALTNYQVFRAAPFATGATAEQVSQDDTTAVIAALRDDGIGYAIASQVLDQDNVKVIRMHSTLPDDPRYPFSQPRGYVYLTTASPAAQAFLGFATAPEGQAAVTEAKASEAEAVAAGETVTTGIDSAAGVAASGLGVGVLSSGLIAFSPDGQAIASAAEDSAQLWDLDGTPIGELRHGAEVTSVAYKPDGQAILTAGDNGNLRLWDANGQPIGEPLEAHEGGRTVAVFSPDGQQIASGGEDGAIRLWSAAGQPIGNPFNHEGEVAAIAFSPAGQTLASAGESTIRLWNLQGNPIGSPIQAEGEFTSLAFSPDGQTMAAATEDGTIRLWDLQGNPIGSPIQAEADLTSLAFSPDGQTILATGEDGTIRLWDLQGNPLGEMFEGDEAIAAAAFSPDGQTIAGVGDDGVVTLLNAQGAPIGAPFGGETNGAGRFPLWLLLLIPLALLALLLWWLSKRRSTSTVTPANSTIASGVTPMTSTGAGVETASGVAANPKEGGDLASRAGSVIASDRVSIAGDRPSLNASPPVDPNAPAATGVMGAMPTPLTLSGDAAAIAGGAALAAGAGIASLPLLAGLISEGESRLVLEPYSPDQVRARWKTSEAHRAIARQRDGRQFALRLYDVTDVDPSAQAPHWAEQIALDETAQSLLLSVPTADRDYLAEIGYITTAEQWLALARSNSIRMPNSFDTASTVIAPKATTPKTAPEPLTPPQIATVLLDQADGAFPAPASPPALAIGGAALGAEATESGDVEPTADDLGAAALGSAALGAIGLGIATADDDLAGGTASQRDQANVEATKFNVGQTDLSSESLAAVDADLPDLPEGYGESRIVLMPRDPQWGYTYWDVPNSHKEELRHQGGQRLALRFYDVTDIDLNHQRPHNLQQFHCDELARDWYIPIPVSDRDYVVEIGYVAADGRWLMLARSASVRIPPIYPSDWSEDYFMTTSWSEDLRGKTLYSLVPPSQRTDPAPDNPLYEQIFDLSQSVEAQRVAGSLYGSMQMIPEQAVSSYVSQSGVGMGALPTMSGMGMSGIGMSGVGFSASAAPIRPRKFWLVADAELIVYGATEPDATVTVGDRVIQLSLDGTFRFQMSFQDGAIDYPIVAVAADGEQNRAIHMEFERETPERRTNTKDEAIDEWL